MASELWKVMERSFAINIVQPTDTEDIVLIDPDAFRKPLVYSIH